MEERGEAERFGELLRAGQSYWLDNLSRAMLRDGSLARRVEHEGLRGVTSNPAIFEKAITSTDLYDEQLERLAGSAASLREIYEALVVADVRDACDLLRPVWQESDGVDGYVSLEVSPRRMHDTAGSIEEGRRLWAAVDRPNLMIKIPGTPAGVPAIEELLFEGVNVNVTLLFSVAAYRDVADAHERALRRRHEAGRPLGSVASVASFFLSRIDVLVDSLLSQRLVPDRHGAGPAPSLFGAAALASARRAYRHFEERTASDGWRTLAGGGARPQRLLWASTSTKNPLYDPVRYVTPLVGPDTVNTLPESTIEAFARSGEVRPGAIRDGRKEADEVFERLAEAGIDMDAVCARLVDEGAVKFIEPFDRLLETLLERRREFLRESRTRVRLEGSAAEAADAARLAALAERRTGVRLAAADASLWTGESGSEESGRAIRLDAAERATGALPALLDFAREIRESDVEQVVLLADGDAAAAARAFAAPGRGRAIDGRPGLRVLASANPAAVREASEQVEFGRTLFVVASASGDGLLPRALARYFLARAARCGERAPGARFVAIGRADSPLLREAEQAEFLRRFEVGGNVTGRFAALDAFGLLPAALTGVNVEDVVAAARDVALECGPDVPEAVNPGLRLGLVLAAAAESGRGPLEILPAPGLEGLAAWIERLVTGSLGPAGLAATCGPVGRRPAAGPVSVSVALAVGGEPAAGTIRARLPRREAAGGEIVRWHHAVAVAASLLGVDPLRDPAAARDRAVEAMLAAVEARDGTTETRRPAAAVDGVELYRPESDTGEDRTDEASIASLLRGLISASGGTGVTTLAAFLPPGEGVERRLSDLCAAVAGRGAAPLLHHGEPAVVAAGAAARGEPGCALVLTAAAADDVPLPDATYGFAQLERTLAARAEEELREGGIRVLRADLGWYPEEGLEALIAALA
ncbi:MAG: transaldolase [Gemmatimonadota bacterium]|nr:transaldolase [Gemmatimonadota bacterium]